MHNTDARPALSLAEIRLECLKLAHRLDRTPEQVIADARRYLDWVGGVVPTTLDGPGDRTKESKTTAPQKRTSSPP